MAVTLSHYLGICKFGPGCKVLYLVSSFDHSQEVRKGTGEVLYDLPHIPAPAVESLQDGTHY